MFFLPIINLFFVIILSMTIDCEKLWKDVLVEIELNTSKANFSTWFRETYISKCENGVVYVGVPNNFVREWLLNKYHRFIVGALRNIHPNIRNIEYSIVSQPSSPTKENQTIRQNYQINTEEQLGFSELYVDKEANLNPKYTFDSFVVASFNEIAHAAALSVAQSPGVVYNPLFLYGGVGLGKTHLLQAIGNEVKKRAPNLKVYYLTSEKFANEFVNSIQNKTTHTFKEKYRNYNLLIVDDIQFFSNKLKTQEELFHVFNSIYENSNQLVFSSDCPPQHIIGLEERLRSRFEGGMMVDISQPEFEARLAILKVKTRLKGFQLPEEVLELIALNIKENIRELEGALNSIVGQSRIKGKILSNQEVEEIIKKKSKPIKVVTMDQIIKTITVFYNINEKGLLEKTRRKEIVKPRQIAMYLLRNDLNTSYPSIGRRFGQKDHTTVIHACKKIDKIIKIDKKTEQEICSIRDMLYKNGV